MLSIRPKWVEKIARGEKTIEVRKTRPKMNTPFKCYIYCTLQGCNEFFRVDLGRDVAKWNRGKWADRKGKVIGEFTCDRIYELQTKAHGGSYYVKNEDQPTTNFIARQSCLDLKDMHDYLHAQKGYGWHITDLRIYDAPRELSEFLLACPNSWYCESCAMYWENNGTCGNESLQIKHAPQSWCYVEAMEDV
jgi:predicted transcriptional regulator